MAALTCWWNVYVHVYIYTCSRSTSSPSFMFLVWIRRISRRPVASGIPMSTSRSKRPVNRVNNMVNTTPIMQVDGFQLGKPSFWTRLHKWKVTCKKTICSLLYCIPFINSFVHTKSPKSSVNTIRSVSSSHNDNMWTLFKTIHQRQQLGYNTSFNFTMSLVKKKYNIYLITLEIRYKHFEIIVLLHFLHSTISKHQTLKW